MAKAAKKKEPKKRAEKYEEKVTFDGTFEDMIGISVKDAEKKKTNTMSTLSKKYAVGDFVKLQSDPNKDTFIVVSINIPDPNNLNSSAKGFDYLVSRYANSAGKLPDAQPPFPVFEEDLYR